jgi:hypothetical protein
MWKPLGGSWWRNLTDKTTVGYAGDTAVAAAVRRAQLRLHGSAAQHRGQAAFVQSSGAGGLRA